MAYREGNRRRRRRQGEDPARQRQVAELRRRARLRRRAFVRRGMRAIVDVIAPRWLAAVVTLLGAGGVWFLLNSSMFTVTRIETPGVNDHSITSVAAAQLAASHRRLIFAYDAASVVQRVRQLPSVASATGMVVLPNVVTLQVTMEQAAYVLEAGRYRYTVGVSGVVMAPASSSSTLPVLYDVDAGASLHIFPGVHVNPALAGWAKQNRARVTTAVNGAHYTLGYSSADGAFIFLPHSVTVYLGALNDVPTKLAILHAVLGQIGANSSRVTAIHVEDENRPYVTG